MLGTLANQLAISIENSRLLSEARAATDELQKIYNEFVRSEWKRTSEKAEQAGFRYNNGRIEMIEATVASDATMSAVDLGRPTANQSGGSEQKRGIVAVPVKVRGEIIGVIQIESADASRSWKSDELDLVEAVAERAAFAMENARLFQDARRRASKERMISDATTRIGGSLNVENILQATAIELERVLGGSEVTIRFGDKDSV